MSVNISIQNATLHDHAKVVDTINEGSPAGQADKALKELEVLRLDLEKMDQLKDAITSLETAIREQNQPSVRSAIQKLTSDFASSFLANMLSSIVSPFL